MPDFGLLTQPNFAQAALGGYQAGAALGKQRQVDAALGNLDLERPETLLPLLRADPSTGAALIGASTRIAAQKRDNEARQATATYLKTIMPGAGSVASSGASATPPATAPASDPAEIVVTAQKNPNAARDAAIDADPEAFLKIQSQLGTMQKADRERLGDAADAFGNVAQGALALPYAQRKSFLSAQTGYLTQHGVSPDQIAAFDPTDDALHTEVGKATGIKFQIEQADKDRNYGLARDRLSHDVAHDAVTESQGAERIGIERGNQGIAAGHLALDRKKEAREAGVGGGNTMKRTLANGVTAYRNPTNGKWYDNPEFR